MIKLRFIILTFLIAIHYANISNLFLYPENRLPASLALNTSNGCFSFIERIASIYNLRFGTSRFGFGDTISYTPNSRNVIPLSEKNELKLVSYNLDNLVFREGTAPVSANFDHIRARQEQGRLLLQMDPDIIVANEIEGYDAAFRFNETMLRNGYVPLILAGNSPNFIETAFFIKRTLNVKATLHSFGQFRAPGSNSQARQLAFTRDFPVLELRRHSDADNARPFLVIGGTHLKSLMTENPDRGRHITDIRRREVEAMMSIQTRIESQYGQGRTAFVIAGDFNNGLDSNPRPSEFQALSRANYRDAFDLVANPQLGAIHSRATHITFDNMGRASQRQLDSIQLNPFLSQNNVVISAGIHRYTEPSGRERAMPTSMRERSQNPSDHFPVWATFNLQTLLGL